MPPTFDEESIFCDLRTTATEPVRNPLRVLFVADASHVANVVQDHIESIVSESRHEITLRNPIVDPAPFSLEGSFDAVLVHYSIYVLSPYYLPEEWASSIRRFRGVKAQIIQDEHRSVERMKRRMRELGIHLVFSSLDRENLRKVYGNGGALGARYFCSLPGYVPRRFKFLMTPPHSGRPYDIVYRGRTLPAYLGIDAQMKAGIGRQVAPIATRRGLRVDISSEEGDRIYGTAWEGFLMNSRATLACEGGASIFDFDGTIARKTQEFIEANPAAEFEEIWRAVLRPYEGNIVHRTITPKIFEAIATRTTLVLYPGRYRDILVPGRHFIALEPDGTNLHDVLEQLRDKAFVEQMANLAWCEVLHREELQFDFYVEALDRLLAEQAVRLAPIGLQGEASSPSLTMASSSSLVAGDRVTRVSEPSCSGPLAGKRLLVAYSNASTFTTTTLEYVESFRRFGSAEVHYLHVSHNAEPDVDLNAYDAVFLSYCARLCFPGYVSKHFLRLLNRYDGVKAIAIQDEYDFVEKERRALDRIRPDVVFTCVPAEDRARIYPPERYPQTEFVQVLTGYVPSSIPRKGCKPVAGRPIALGYRGRTIGPRYGRLAEMKQRIGEVFREECLHRQVAADIAVDEASRIYGDVWYDWLASCRCVLGTESGSNIFDFDGTIAAACRDSQQTGEPLPGAIAARIRELDDTFDMGQISPRVFESALLGTPMALYLGRYSNVLQPYVHYIPIEQDHSNLDEVFDILADDGALQAIADRTYQDLIASGAFEYSRLVTRIEESLAKNIRPGRIRAARAPAYPPTTPADMPPHVERATTNPRLYDSFQLRMLRSEFELRTPATRVIAIIARRSRFVAGVERRLRQSKTFARVLLAIRRGRAHWAMALRGDGLFESPFRAAGSGLGRIRSAARGLVTPNYATLDMSRSPTYRLWCTLPMGLRACVRPAAYWLQRWNVVRWIFGKG
jgi:hypothetical protein